LLYDDLSDFRMIIVVYIFFGMIVSVVPCIFVRVTGNYTDPSAPAYVPLARAFVI
jgi:hypothetical protein